MRILKKLVRKLYHLIWFLSIFIFFLPFVRAESDTVYEINFLNRGYMNFPFSTGYAHHETTTYTNNLRIYGTSPDVLNPPKYLYLVTCANANIDYGTNSVSQGNLVHYPQTMGMPCRYTHNGTTHNGYYYLDRWSLTWANYSSSGVYEYGIQWVIMPYNNAGYWVPIRFESIFMSNELIIDFDSYALLYSMVNSNGTINNNINSVKQDTNALKQGQNEIKQKQDETNRKLDDLNTAQQETNDTIKDENAPTIDLSDIQTSNTPISDLVTLPLTLLNSIYSGISGACSNWSLLLPFNHTILLQCFTISDYVGSSVTTIIDCAICLFMAYRIILLFIAVFNDITTLSDTYTNYVKRGRY